MESPNCDAMGPTACGGDEREDLINNLKRFVFCFWCFTPRFAFLVLRR